MKDDKRLWNPDHFIWIGFLFTFYPVAIMYALNCGRMGDTQKQNRTLLISTGIFILMLAAGYLFPIKGLASGIAGASIGLAIILKKEQKDKYIAAVGTQGKSPVMFVFVPCLLITSLLVWMAISAINVPDKYIDIKGSTIFYTDNTDKTLVERVGGYLYATEFLTEESAASIKIDVRSEYVVFSMAINEESRKSLKDDEAAFMEKNRETLTRLTRELSSGAFGGKKVKFEFCDDLFKRLAIFE